MKNPSLQKSTPTLRDAYKVSGFRVRAKIESYEEVTPPAFVLTLDRRSKKQCVVVAKKYAVADTINAGDGRVILDVVIEKSPSTFLCAASTARRVA